MNRYDTTQQQVYQAWSRATARLSQGLTIDARGKVTAEEAEAAIREAYRQGYTTAKNGG